MNVRLALALATLLGTAGFARAQSCWPVEVRLEVRDASGQRIAPASLDSVITTPARGDERLRERSGARPAHRDTSSYLQLSGSGCRLQVDRVSLYDGAHAMHLDFDMVLDSDRRRGPSSFVIEAPPFRPGTFHLAWDPEETGGAPGAPQRLSDRRWKRVSPY
jgi:hypothetical protein